jgi:hypothetical protein
MPIRLIQLKFFSPTLRRTGAGLVAVIVNHFLLYMKYVVFTFLALASLGGTAQKKITLSPEPITVADVFYFRNIAIHDSRIDTTILGRVVKGIAGVNESLAPLKLKGATVPSLAAFYEACTEHLIRGEQDILIHLTDIFLDEEPTLGVTGTVDVRAEVYAVKEGLYYPIYTLDRYELLSAYDATKKLIRELNTSLKNIVEYANNFYKPDVLSKKGLTWDEVMAVKENERKQKYPQYAANVPQDGIYGSFQEFLENKPGRPVNMLEELIAKNMEKPKRKREVIFGYCKEGDCYLLEGKKYDTSRVYRRDNNFYMQNYGIDHDKQEDQNALSWFTGLALLMNTDSWYEYLLNPRTGNWYQLKKLGNKKRPEATAPAADTEQADGE